MVDARIQRLLKIRNVQLTAALSKLAKSEEALRAADEARAFAQGRFDVVLVDSLSPGEFVVDDLVERRAKVEWEARLLNEASVQAARAHEVRDGHAEESKAMSLKMRQAESMSEAALRAFQEEEERRDRARNDEFAAHGGSTKWREGSPKVDRG
jgi:hypothetical protein